MSLTYIYNDHGVGYQCGKIKRRNAFVPVQHLLGLFTEHQIFLKPQKSQD